LVIAGIALALSLSYNAGCLAESPQQNSTLFCMKLEQVQCLHRRPLAVLSATVRRQQSSIDGSVKGLHGSICRKTALSALRPETGTVSVSLYLAPSNCWAESLELGSEKLALSLCSHHWSLAELFLDHINSEHYQFTKL
jgi:hypothetical protein